MKVTEFLKEAKDGLVTVEFMKVRDGGKRVMACTLNNDTAKSFGLIPYNVISCFPILSN